MLALQTRLQHTESDLDANLQRFERQRLGDMKRVLSDFLRAEMQAHCRALERLSKAEAALAAVSEDAGVDALADTLARLRSEAAEQDRSLMEPVSRGT